MEQESTKATMKINLSVIIPVYNEKTTILKILEEVKESKEVFEIVVVEDCSTDGTKEILQKIKDPKVNIYFNSENQGKGASVLKGFSLAKGNFVVIQDADLEYSPKDFTKLLSPIRSGEGKIVYGSRFLNAKLDMLWWIYLGNKFLTIGTNLLFGSRLTDMTTCYKLMSRDILKGLKLNSKRFEIDLELTAAFLRKGYKIVEVPITYQGRNYKEGKKITWLDGLRDILLLFKYRFLNSF